MLPMYYLFCELKQYLLFYAFFRDFFFIFKRSFIHIIHHFALKIEKKNNSINKFIHFLLSFQCLRR